MNTASAPNSSARLITTSMSNRWYRSTDTPIAIGIRPNEKTETFCRTVIQPGWCSRPMSP